MFRNLFLYLTARRYVGKIVSCSDQQGAMPLEVRSVSLLGLTGVAIDGDVVHCPWSAVSYLIVGVDSDRAYHNRREMLAKRNAARDAGGKPGQEPLFSDEKSAMEFLASVGVE